jgi:hypothetical protein
LFKTDLFRHFLNGVHDLSELGRAFSFQNVMMPPGLGGCISNMAGVDVNHIKRFNGAIISRVGVEGNPGTESRNGMDTGYFEVKVSEFTTELLISRLTLGAEVEITQRGYRDDE